MSGIIIGITKLELLQIMTETARDLWSAYSDDKKVSIGEIIELLSELCFALSNAADPGIPADILSGIGGLLGSLQGVFPDGGRA